jgi:DNA-binding GntR family transcriptional regulator
MSLSARIHKPLPSRDDKFSAEANEVGLSSGHQTEVSIGPASPEVAARLEIDGAQEVVHRRTLRFTNEEPSVLEDAYYPAIIGAAARPANIDDIDQRLDALGYLRAGWFDAIAARPATPDEATLLRLETGQPVVDHTRVQYSMRIGDEVRPVSYISIYIRTVFTGDRNRLVYQYKQPDVPLVDEPIPSAGTTSSRPDG